MNITYRVKSYKKEVYEDDFYSYEEAKQDFDNTVLNRTSKLKYVILERIEIDDSLCETTEILEQWRA